MSSILDEKISKTQEDLDKLKFLKLKEQWDTYNEHLFSILGRIENKAFIRNTYNNAYQVFKVLDIIETNRIEVKNGSQFYEKIAYKLPIEESYYINDASYYSKFRPVLIDQFHYYFILLDKTKEKIGASKIFARDMGSSIGLNNEVVIPINSATNPDYNWIYTFTRGLVEIDIKMFDEMKEIISRQNKEIFDFFDKWETNLNEAKTKPFDFKI